MRVVTWHNESATDNILNRNHCEDRLLKSLAEESATCLGEKVVSVRGTRGELLYKRKLQELNPCVKAHIHFEEEDKLPVKNFVR